MTKDRGINATFVIVSRKKRKFRQKAPENAISTNYRGKNTNFVKGVEFNSEICQETALKTQISKKNCEKMRIVKGPRRNGKFHPRKKTRILTKDREKHVFRQGEAEKNANYI